MSDKPFPTELADLVGETVLELVPKTDLCHPLSGEATGAIFTLEDRTYLVFEDPSDGYRSGAGPLLSFNGSAYKIGGDWYPTYIREAVLCTIRTKGAYGGEDYVLELRSKKTGQLIFEIGTENVDDYYPSYVCRWSPEGLSANAKSELEE